MAIKVMLIEDEAGMRLLLRKIIEKHPEFEVVAECGELTESVIAFNRRKPEVVFLDIGIKGQNGIECAKILTDLNPKVKIIFATAHTEYMSEAFELYAFDYLVKPFNLDRVKRTLNRIVEQMIPQEYEPEERLVKSEYRQDKLLVKGRESMSFIHIPDIILIQRENNATVIYTEKDSYVTQENYTDAVIWELHVRDFSIDENSGMENKGKYLAFTESGTTVPGTEIATGVDYMKQLGVNYVHLLPVYDINSVDETKGGYNWGYDPKNYNVPEGSYSTDPYNGAVRVNEFKQMVQSLHDNGIGVIMDVVYNHVADAGQFCFNQIVPGYFSRIHDDGSYQSNSGCGNDTASERSMVSKYIVDSVLYWNTEYHIDGFRWDLVGLIDYETINAVMAAVHAVNPDIIFYGEGWEMCSWTTKDEGEWASDPYSKKMTIQPNDMMVNTEAGTFAFFNDTIRNVIHGGVFTATDKGFVCGMNEWTKETVTDSYMAYSKWGSNSERVDTPLQTVNYASCHDNYTLFDNFTVDALDLNGLALSAENAAKVAEQAARYNNLAAAYYITAQGVPFIHAGEEMLRSKPHTDAENNFVFDHNSYSSGDGVNSFKWSELANELNAASYDYYKGLIAFRKAHPALRMTEQAEILATMEALETGSDNVIAILNNGGNGEDAQILTVINAGGDATVTLPEGEWNVYVNAATAGTEIIETVSGEIEVEATSALILVKAEEEVPEESVPSTPIQPGKPNIGGIIGKWMELIDGWFNPGCPSEPTEPEVPETTEPEVPETTEPEETVPTTPVVPGWGSWFKWFWPFH